MANFIEKTLEPGEQVIFKGQNSGLTAGRLAVLLFLFPLYCIYEYNCGLYYRLMRNLMGLAEWGASL